MPRRLQVEFSALVQGHTDKHGTEVSPDELWTLFSNEYLREDGRIRLESHRLLDSDEVHRIELTLTVDGRPYELTKSTRNGICRFVVK